MSDSVKKGVGLTPQGFDFLESDTDIAQVKTGDAASAKIPDVLSFPDIPVPPLAKDIEKAEEGGRAGVLLLIEREGRERFIQISFAEKLN